MNLYKIGCLCCLLLSLSSCDPWYLRRPPVDPVMSRERVWGSKPVYASTPEAMAIKYEAGAQPMKRPGNIYAYQTWIFQVDQGRGIHVVDNRDKGNAQRVGFIRINGCSQLSIRGAYLYTNSLADLVTLDISVPEAVREVNRVPNTFTTLRYQYFLVEPDSSGWYECPRYDSVVVAWVRDSIYQNCYKR